MSKRPRITIVALLLLLTGILLLTREERRGAPAPEPAPQPTPRPARPAARESLPERAPVEPATEAADPLPLEDFDVEIACPPMFADRKPDLKPQDPPPVGEVRTLRGSVTRRDGRALVAPRIEFVALSRQRGWVRVPAQVASDGAFAIEGVPVGLVGSSILLLASDEGLVFEDYLFTDPDRELLVVLKSPCRYSGRILDEEGAPVAGASFSAYYTPFHHFATGSEPDGRFSFFAPGSWGGLVQVRVPGNPRFWFQLPGDAEHAHDLGDLVANRPRPISGQVLDEEGRPVAQVAVALHGRNRGDHAGTVKTDAEGRFRIENVGPGPHDACTAFTGPDGKLRGARQVALFAGRKDVRLVVAPAYQVTLSFRHRETGEPVATVNCGTSVRAAKDPEEHTWHREWRGRRESVTLTFVRPGRHLVHVSSPTHGGEWTEVEVGPESRTVEVLLRPHRED